MAKLSAIVIARNEAQRIAPCLEGLSWANELVVVDSLSTDQTVEVCRRFTDRVYQVPFVSFPKQRNAAMRLAAHDWVLFVDADERVSLALRDEIRGLVRSIPDLPPPDHPAGYRFPRRNLIWGGWVRGGGWYPDYQLRLLHRPRARYDETRQVHEVVQLDGPSERLQNELLHLNYDSFGQFFAKQELYSRLQARTWYEAGLHPKPWALCLQPGRVFMRRFISLRGYVDGWRGLLLATFLAYCELRAYLELWRLRRSGHQPEGE